MRKWYTYYTSLEFHPSLDGVSDIWRQEHIAKSISYITTASRLVDESKIVEFIVLAKVSELNEEQIETNHVFY